MSQSPQLGYNHNIPHRGRLFHVQTEDSGRQRGHIFTHVFFHGTIIASNKVEYLASSEEGDNEELDQKIIELMKESHKAMIRSLRGQEFDEKIVQLLGPHPEGEAEEKSKEATASVDDSPRGRAPSAPRPAPEMGPPLRSDASNPAIDPGLSHPLFAHKEAQEQMHKAAAARAEDKATPRRGPRRVRRRAVGGIGGQGVTDGASVGPRRDVVIGQFASEHQAELDEEILALLDEE